MKAPVSIVEQRHRFIITGHDMADFVILVSCVMITIKFWNWMF